jgi:hypothetical protein
VGTDCFRGLALNFQAEHPSRAGNLHSVGEPFPAFLRSRFDTTSYDYLPDVAALEWACQEVLVAAECLPLRLDALRAIAPQAYGGLHFALRPRRRLITSRFPIMQIWSANQPDADSSQRIDLGCGPDFILLGVESGAIELRRLAPSEFSWLQALAAGSSLGEALDAVLAANRDFDLGATLRRSFALGLFSGVS